MNTDDRKRLIQLTELTLLDYSHKILFKILTTSFLSFTFGIYQIISQNHSLSKIHLYYTNQLQLNYY